MKRSVLIGLLMGLCLWLVMGSVALAADPLDEAQAKLGAFLDRMGKAALVLLPSTGGLAVAGLSIKRALAKAAGEEDSMVRSNNQIYDVLKYTAIGSGTSLLVAIAGSVLK